MSAFVGNVTNNQCRTHHQKEIIKVDKEEHAISSFYNTYYKERLLDAAHLRTEIMHCLA